MTGETKFLKVLASNDKIGSSNHFKRNIIHDVISHTFCFIINEIVSLCVYD